MRKRCVQTYERKSLTQKLTKGGLRKTTKRVLAGVLATAMVLTSGVVLPQNKTVAEAAGFTSVGMDNGDGSYTLTWSDYTQFYGEQAPAGDFSISFSFHNDSAGANNYQNYAVAITTDLARGNQQAGDWYMRADAWSNSTFDGSTVKIDYGNINWDTFASILKDANVGVSVSRVGTEITIAHSVVNAEGQSISWSATAKDCPTDAVAVYLGGENCYLTPSKTVRTITVKHVKESDGSEIASDITKKVFEGHDYSITPADVDGYLADTEAVTGTVGAQDEEKTVKYTPVPTHNLTINCVDPDGNEIADPVVQEISEGKKYSIASPTVKGYATTQKTVTGTMGKEDAEVTVTYRKLVATVGTDNGDGTYTLAYGATSSYYSIRKKAGDFSAGFAFHNYSAGDANWNNYSVVVQTESGAEWYERADVYSNAPDWANTAFGNEIVYSGGPDWATYADTIKDAEVGVSITRSGATMTITHTVTGANGESFSWSSTAACPRENVTIYLGGEACMLEIYEATETDLIAPEGYMVTVHYVYADGSEAASDVVQGPFNVGSTYNIYSPEIEGYKADLPIVSGTMDRESVTKTVTYKALKTEPIATVGKSEDGSYNLAFNDVNNYYEVPVSGDFDITFQFHQEGNAENNWDSYAVIVRNAAGSEWYARADLWSVSDAGNTAFGGQAVTYSGGPNWDTFRDAMKDAECVVHVSRTGTTMTMSHDVTGANGVSYMFTATVNNCPTDDVSVWLGGEKVALTVYDASTGSDSEQPTDKPAESTPTPTPDNSTSTPSEPTPTPDNSTNTPSEPTSTPAVEKGDKVSNSNGTYKVTDTSKKTVKYVDDKGSKKKAAVPNTVKVNGKKYKVTAVAKNAFKGNSKVTSVTIGKNVTKIEAGAFKNCKNLKTIVINSTKITSVGKDALKGTNAKLVIKVPAKKQAAYQKLFAGKGNASVVVK